MQPNVYFITSNFFGKLLYDCVQRKYSHFFKTTVIFEQSQFVVMSRTVDF